MALEITNIVEAARQTLAPVGNTLSDTWAALRTASADLTATERGMSLYRACKPAAVEG